MIKRILILLTLGAIYFNGCMDGLGPDELEDLTLIDLQIVTDSDTLLILSGRSETLSVQGVYVKSQEHIVSNRGVFADTSITIISIDTVLRTIKRSLPEWLSTNENVATVSKGVVSGVNAGTVNVTAVLEGIVSNATPVKVSTPQLPPDLTVDPPPVQLVFQDSSQVSGWVVTGLDVTLKVNNDTISYSEVGRFTHTVHLDTGYNAFTITAINNMNGLSTQRSKKFIYYPLPSAGIEGHWVGETLTRPFSFDIIDVFGQYVIDGVLTVDFTLLGGPLIVQDIVVAGFINRDGTIEAEMNEESSGFTFTGKLDGIFYSTGTAGGSYSLKIEKSGWPSLSFSQPWTAEKQSLTD